jgi:hypothetical protein
MQFPWKMGDGIPGIKDTDHRLQPVGRMHKVRWSITIVGAHHMGPKIVGSLEVDRLLSTASFSIFFREALLLLFTSHTFQVIPTISQRERGYGKKCHNRDGHENDLR